MHKKKKEENEAKAKKTEEQNVAKKKQDKEAAAAKKKDEEITAAKKEQKETADTVKKKNQDHRKTKDDENKDAKSKNVKTDSPTKSVSKVSKAVGVFSKITQIKDGKGFFWATADVYRGKPVEYIIFSMRDFVFYLMFLVLVGLIAFGDLDIHQNYYGNTVAEVLTNSKFVTYTGKTKTFSKIRSIPEIWVFIKVVVLKVVHNAYYETYEEYEGFKALDDSILVGIPRMRQKRVRNGTCRTAKLFEDLYRSCYDYYSDGIEDKADFGSGHLTSSAWKYTDAVGDEASYTAHASKYGVGGFVMNFSSNLNLTTQWLQELEQNLWIRLGSRAVFLEFALYSPNANLFCIVKLVFEILPSGGVESETSIITAKLWHETGWDWFIFGCKVIFFAYTLYFTLEEITQIIILKESYLSNGWNILDSTIVTTCYAVIVSGVDHFKAALTLSAKMHNVHGYSSFDNISRSLATYKLATTVLTVFVFLKLFKFAVLSKTMSFLLSTFHIASYQIMSWTLAMIGVVSGFALFGTTVLDEVLQFRSFTESFFTLFGLYVGGLYFAKTNKNALKAGAKIFLSVYIIFVLVIFFSAYTAIIVHGFRKAVFEHGDDRTQVHYGDVFDMLTYKICHFWKSKSKTAGALYKKEAEQLVTRNFDELLDILRRRGCRGMELALILKKHNVRPGTIVPFETMSELYNDFLARCQLSVEVEGHTEIWDKLEKIFDTVDFLDMTLGDIWTKMDALANRLNIRKGEKKPTQNKKKWWTSH